MKVGRNDPCPCGSGKKYKHCCYEKDSVKHEMSAAEDAEPKDTNDAVAEDDERGGDQASTETHQSHQKDRSRFMGQTRGRAASFKSMAPRGSRRGS